MARHFKTPITAKEYVRLIEQGLLTAADLDIAVNGPAWMAPGSIPEPDIFLIQRLPLQLRRRPRPEDIALLIEVCDSSFSWDRFKTPHDPRTGESDLLLDPLDWIHAVALQVRDPRRRPAAHPPPARAAGPVCCVGF